MYNNSMSSPDPQTPVPTTPGSTTPVSTTPGSMTDDGAKTTPSPRSDYRIRCRRLPLAVYREVEAHLQQVDGVNAGLLPQTSQEFDYLMSQTGGIWISYQPNVDVLTQRRVEEILAYYSDRFGAWEVIYPESPA